MAVGASVQAHAYTNENSPAPSSSSVEGSASIQGAGANATVTGTSPSDEEYDVIVTSICNATGQSDDEYLTIVGVAAITGTPSVVCVNGNVDYAIATQPTGHEYMVSWTPADTSTPGIKEAVATCGTSSATCTVTVIKVETETVATTPADRTRTKIGIGEEVVCSIVPSMSVNCSVTGGGTVSPTTGNSTTFTASKSPSSSTVHAQIARADCTVTFMVVAPDGMTTSLASDGNLGSLGTNNIGAKSFFDCYVLPNDVSFYNVEFRENIPGEAYTWPDGTGGSRLSAIVPWGVAFDNKTTDTVSSGLDPVARIFDGTNYVDFTYGVCVPEEYKNEAGT